MSRSTQGNLRRTAPDRGPTSCRTGRSSPRNCAVAGRSAGNIDVYTAAPAPTFRHPMCPCMVALARLSQSAVAIADIVASFGLDPNGRAYMKEAQVGKIGTMGREVVRCQVGRHY